MLSFRARCAIVFSAALAVTPAFAAHTHRSAHAHSASSHNPGSRKAAKSHRLHGQQAIDPARVTQIQQALIREHYLATEATGKWDATTEAAMQKFQADQGWQTKLMPDSRALMKLGLGPDYSTAINAKSASFAAPLAPGTTPPAQQAAFAAAAGITR
jgi:hypothetical protein